MKLNQVISSAFTSIVTSLGFLKFLELLVPISEPQLMQVSFPKDTVPHLEQVFNCDLKEFKPMNIIKNINSGTKKISNKILPKKLIRKLNPKMGITIKKIKE